MTVRIINNNVILRSNESHTTTSDDKEKKQKYFCLGSNANDVLSIKTRNVLCKMINSFRPF